MRSKTVIIINSKGQWVKTGVKPTPSGRIAMFLVPSRATDSQIQATAARVLQMPHCFVD